ncbi:unnamed protein product [Tenebrio molitor]|nr:unnamed protein product [Tenebrio molitor]
MIHITYSFRGSAYLLNSYKHIPHIFQKRGVCNGVLICSHTFK